MHQTIEKITACLKPQPNVLVSCRSKTGEDNALAVGYCCNCSYDPPMIMAGIVPSRYSYHMIKETGVFVVNLPSRANRALFDYCGSHSGRDENKLQAIGASVRNATKIDAPILADCPVQIECKVKGSIQTGSHEMFAGEIVAIHADENVINEDGEIDFTKIDLL